LLALAPLGCARHATAGECLELLDRYVELAERAADPKVSELRIREDKERSREKAAKTPSFAECPSEVTRDALACAMRAPNADELEKCLE
jgi:hypothetical protein